jgi:hypothetical protein
MLPLVDTQVRLVLLNHVAVRLAEAQPDELHAAASRTSSSRACGNCPRSISVAWLPCAI